MLRSICIAVALAASSTAWADQFYLSDLLGVPSGSVATASNPPVFSIVVPTSYGIGADRPGDFAGNKIQFTGMAAFNKGLGMHSLQSGFAEIAFDLGALAPAGQGATEFHAYAGIDIASGGFGTSEFQVLLDGVVKADVIVGAAGAPSLLVIDTTGASMLTLRTHSISHPGAHASFGDAFVLTSPVPEPGTLAMMLAGGLGLLVTRRRTA